jgi:hypothetical protein
MQTAIAEILLNGNINNTVVKKITAAEAPILRFIHGNDALLNAKADETFKRTNIEEVERLKAFYGEETFAKVYPGSLPKLPATLVEVGLSEPEVVEEIKPLKKVN